MCSVFIAFKEVRARRRVALGCLDRERGRIQLCTRSLLTVASHLRLLKVSLESIEKDTSQHHQILYCNLF